MDSLRRRIRRNRNKQQSDTLGDTHTHTHTRQGCLYKAIPTSLIYPVHLKDTFNPSEIREFILFASYSARKRQQNCFYFVKSVFKSKLGVRLFHTKLEPHHFTVRSIAKTPTKRAL